MSEIFLALPVFFPIVCGALLLIFRKQFYGAKRERIMEWLIEGVVLANSVIVFLLITQSEGGPLTIFRLLGNLTVTFKLDGMGKVFAGLVAFLWPLATLYAFEYMEHDDRKQSFFGFYVLTYGVTVGIAFAGNLVTMYLFYEMLTLVTFPLVLHPMSKQAVLAARKYLYYSIGGAAFAFLGLIFIIYLSGGGSTEFIAGGILDSAMAANNKNLLLLIYVLGFFGFGVKAALFPCHGWLPDATIAPTPVTALLHAVAVVKSGAFAVLRFTYFSFGVGFLRGTWAQWIVMAAALITIAYGSTMAVKEVHWKRRLAYSTISNLSYILFGATLMSPFGLVAALCHMVTHAFMKICAFFCAGAVMHKTEKTYIYQLDGMGKRMPLTFACLTVSSLSLMGIPLFAGFISKWNLGLAAFEVGSVLPIIGVCVILYSALMTGIYMMTVLVRAYFPKKAEEKSGAKCDPTWRMLVPLFIFVIVIILIGVHPEPLMNVLTTIGGEIG